MPKDVACSRCQKPVPVGAYSTACAALSPDCYAALSVATESAIVASPNPFDFYALSTQSESSKEEANEFNLGEGPMRMWRNVHRGLGLVTLATLMGPAIAPVLLLIPIAILLLGAMGLITVEDIQAWMLPFLGMLLWLMPLAIAGVRTAGVGQCIAAPSEAGVKGLAVASLVLNAILALCGAAAFLLVAVARFQDDPTLEMFAGIALIPYVPLTVIEVIVFLVFLMQVGAALRRPELKREVIRFFIWLGVWIACQGVMLLLLAVFGAVLWLYVINVIVFVSFLIRYLLLLRTARGVLMRLFRLNMRAA